MRNSINPLMQFCGDHFASKDILEFAFTVSK
jgi:hypothetical protein